MRTRIVLLLNMIIYLFVNGPVFAKPIHLCQAMAVHNITSTSALSTDIPHIHQHKKVNNQVVDSIKTDSSMNNCQCVDCDCSANLVSQVNLTMVSEHELASYFSVIQQITHKSTKAYLSQPLSNLYRPPILS